MTHHSEDGEVRDGEGTRLRGGAPAPQPLSSIHWLLRPSIWLIRKGHRRLGAVAMWPYCSLYRLLYRATRG